MKKKYIVVISLIVSLSTLFLPWFGGYKGVQDVNGIILFQNPIAVSCIVISFVGLLLKNEYKSKVVTQIGLLGIIAMQIYEFFNWYSFNSSFTFDLRQSMSMCYPEFYFALLCMIGTYVLFFVTNKSNDLTF
ncbi:MAG: hypothetical protein RR630_01025 [Coprobacillus sp.]